MKLTIQFLPTLLKWLRFAGATIWCLTKGRDALKFVYVCPMFVRIQDEKKNLHKTPSYCDSVLNAKQVENAVQHYMYWDVWFSKLTSRSNAATISQNCYTMRRYNTWLYALQTQCVQQSSAVIEPCCDMPAIFELSLLQGNTCCLIMVYPRHANVLRKLRQSARDKCTHTAHLWMLVAQCVDTTQRI